MTERKFRQSVFKLVDREWKIPAEIPLTDLDDSYVEQMFISQQKGDLRNSYPGKYDKRLLSLNILSNLSASALSFSSESKSGLGIFPALEISYHWGRGIDDVADGDAPVPVPGMSVLDWLLRQQELIASGNWQHIAKEPTLEYMMRRTLERIKEIPTLKIDPELEAFNFLEAMIVECKRRIDGMVLTDKELSELNNNSFGVPHTITLAILGSRAMGEDVWELGQAQGKMMGLRDIHQELRRWICNIPLEVLEKSGLTLADLQANPNIFDSNTILQEWRVSEMATSKALIEQLKDKDLDPVARLYTWYLSHEVSGHVKRLS